MADRSEPSARVWTVPNVLSFLRLALVPFFLGYLVVGDYVAALVVLAVSSFTDLLDGYLARRLNQITRLGQLLDPAADRLYLFAAIVGLAARDLLPWWLVVVIVGRDVFLAVLGIVLANHGFGPLPVHQLGKVATFALFLGLPVIMLGAAFPATAAVAEPLGWAIVLWGGGIPLLVGRRHLRDRDRTRHSVAAASGRPAIRYAGAIGRCAVGEPGQQQDDSEQVDQVSPDTTLSFSREQAAQIAALDADLTAEEEEAVQALPTGSALLVVRRGPNAGARFLLDADVTTAGRHPDADIFLDDVTVSRHHAQFLRHGTAFEVKDLGSLNGTYFDGVRIETALLADGAEVQVGKFRLTFYASRSDLAGA